MGTGLQNHPLFDLKLVYFFVIEVADSETDLGLFSTALVPNILLFYHLLDYARGRSVPRGHLHIFQNFYTIFVLTIMKVIKKLLLKFCDYL